MVEFNATFLIAMLSFVVFIMIMNAIFYNPILNIMRKREEYINSNYTQAKQYMEQAADFDNQRKVKINETHNRCRENIMNIVDNAHLEANKKTHEARDHSKAEIAAGKNVLAEKERDLENTIKNTVVKDLASTIMSKFLHDKSEL